MSQKSDCCKVIIVKADNNSRVNSVAVEYVTNLLNEESTNNGHCNISNCALLNGSKFHLKTMIKTKSSEIAKPIYPKLIAATLIMQVE